MKAKRASIVNPAFEQMRILKVSQALNIDAKIVQYLFTIFEKNSGKQLQIGFDLALDILKKQYNISVLKSELENYFDTKSNTLEFMQFCKLYIQLKKIQEESDSQEIQIVNSFVALGGQPDKSGVIKKSVIVNIIKNQFQLVFDIEQLLERNTENDNLDYDDFYQIFTKVQQSQKDIGRASFTSITTIKDNQTSDELKIKYQDFENWLLLNGV